MSTFQRDTSAFQRVTSMIALNSFCWYVCSSFLSCMALPVWFDTPRFHANYHRPPNYDAVRAYHGRFRKIAEDPASTRRTLLSLCMLHKDEISHFPYIQTVADFLARNFAQQHGLEVVGQTSYGYVFRGDSWRRYRCASCHEDWVGWYCFDCHTQH